MESFRSRKFPPTIIIKLSVRVFIWRKSESERRYRKCVNEIRTALKFQLEHVSVHEWFLAPIHPHPHPYWTKWLASCYIGKKKLKLAYNLHNQSSFVFLKKRFYFFRERKMLTIIEVKGEKIKLSHLSILVFPSRYLEQNCIPFHSFVFHIYPLLQFQAANFSTIKHKP